MLFINYNLYYFNFNYRYISRCIYLDVYIYLDIVVERYFIKNVKVKYLT